MRLAVMVVASCAAHAAGGWLLARAPQRACQVAAAPVELVVAPPAPPAPPPAPPAPEPPPAASPPAGRAARTPRARVASARALVAAPDAAPASADAPQVAAAPEPEAPLDLTAEPALGGAPTPAAGSGAPGPARGGGGGGRGGQPTVAADLSRRPQPPALDEALQRRYPTEARAAGRAGSAAVRVRVDADGGAHVLSIVLASEPAFGEACRATVEGSRWLPPQDASGAAVATDVTYRCRFEVGASW